MKAGKHPSYIESEVKCACGEIFKTKSTTEIIEVEVCSKCHPFYTGNQTRTAKAGKVDRFNKKYGLDKAA